MPQKTASQAPVTTEDLSAKNHAIRPGQSKALLQALHILTREGKLNQDSRRKLKQVYHLYQFIEPLLLQVLEQQEPIHLVDHGAGKSYLGFILYDLFFKARTEADGKSPGTVYGVEARPELVAHSQALAQEFGFTGMLFFSQTVANALHSPDLPQQVDVVTALHACDTATDDAITFGLARKARFMVLVPCCQAEVARALRSHKGKALSNPLAEMWRRPLHTREFGSQITNVLRALQLEAHGYRVRVTELVGWEHSLKNELIIAERTGRTNSASAVRLQRLLQETGLQSLQTRFFTPQLQECKKGNAERAQR